jgi:predicted DNA-binding transcriptional regulator AlpA
VKLTSRSVAWPRESVMKWLESRPTARPNQAA